MGLVSNLRAIACLDGIGKRWTWVTGQKALGYRVYRRLTCARGALFYAPDWGFSVRNLLNAAASGEDLSAYMAAIQAEVEREEAVESADVSYVFVEGTGNLQITIAVVDDEGAELALVMGVSALTVELLSLAEA